MANSGGRYKERVNLERIECAMRVVAQHIARHVQERGVSPFAEIFERLEIEREKLVQQHETHDRAASFLVQCATRDSQSALTDNEAPLP